MATNLKGRAGVLVAMAPDLLEMAHTFASVIPSVLEAATGFEKFASPILSLLEERVKQQEELVAIEDEVAKTRDLNKELVQVLKAMQYKLVVLESKKHRDGKHSIVDLADASPRAEDVVVLECTTQTSDNLVLSQFEGMSNMMSQLKMTAEWRSLCILTWQYKLAIANFKQRRKRRGRQQWKMRRKWNPCYGSWKLQTKRGTRHERN